MPVSASLPDDALAVAAKGSADRNTASTQSSAPVAINRAGLAGKIGSPSASAARPLPAPIGAQDFSVRIRLLINRVGSANALAQCCGVSEGTVRNWRDGHSDMSRERCVALAQALDISLLWLVTGEGAMKAEFPAANATAARASSPAHSGGIEANPQRRASAIDSRQLAAALRLLQSYIGLAGGSLDSPQRADVLAELYELLGRASESGHAERLIAFHATLGNLLRGNRRALIS